MSNKNNGAGSRSPQEVSNILTARIVSMMQRRKNGIQIPFTICLRDALFVFLRTNESYNAFNKNPKNFVSENKKNMATGIKNMMRARGEIVSSIKVTLAHNTGRIISLGGEIRLTAYDAAIVLLISLIIGNNENWVEILSALDNTENKGDTSFLDEWKKITGRDLWAKKYDDTPLVFGIEYA